MKKILLILLTGSYGFMACGQTNSPAPAPESSGRVVRLGADHFVFSGTTSRQLIYSGNVWITNAQGSLTCERLTLDLPPEGATDSRPTNVVAETNVVINYIKDGQTNRITCDVMTNAYSVVNSVTNDMFTFSGHAKMSNGRGWMTGEPLTYDNVIGKFGGSGVESKFTLPANNSTNGITSPLNLLK